MRPVRCGTTRLAVASLVLLSVFLTVRERLALRGRLHVPTLGQWEEPSMPSILPQDTGELHPPAPAPQKRTVSRAAISTKSVVDSESTGTSYTQCSTPRLDGPRASVLGNVVHGWKRTLPLEIYLCASWFDKERSLAQIYADVQVGGVVWLTFANSAFRDQALNWAAHVYELRKERAMAIAALDKPLQQQLLSHRLPYLGFDHGLTSDLRSNLTGFRRLGALKGTLVLSVLRE